MNIQSSIDQTKFQQIQAVRHALGMGFENNWHSIEGENGMCKCGLNSSGEMRVCGDDLLERVMKLVDHFREYERITNGIQSPNLQ